MLGALVARQAQDSSAVSEPLRADDFTRLLGEHINDGVVIQDGKGHILWSNEAYHRITGYSFKDIAGRKPQEFMLPPDQRISAKDIAEFRYDPTNSIFKGFEIVQNQRKNGDLFWAQLSFGFFDSSQGERVIVTVRDVSEQVAANDALSKAKADLEKAVNFDALTGLANRRKLMEYLGQSLCSASSDGEQVGILHLDLDHFKDINDTHGHAAGDAVIVHAARSMQHHMMERGLAARIGGDEFVIVLPHITSMKEVIRLADDLIAEATNPVTWDGKHLNYSYSIGIALSKSGKTSGQDLIQKADFALYEAKARGRARWAIYDADLRQKHRARKGIAEDLARTVRECGLEFHYQPIVDIQENRIAGVETLARWKHPYRGSIPPNEFLSIAEDIGLLEQVDRTAMKAAALALKRLNALGFENTYVSFNASTHALSNDGLVEEMIWTAAELQVEPRYLAVEVLETVFFAPNAVATQIALQIRKIREAGFAAMLDDFGVGYAGLAHLGQLDVSGLKIDKSLVHKIKTSRAEAVIVRAILQLAEELGLAVVAEGVEDADLNDILARNGCRLVQGFHLARPMTLERLEEWMLDFGAGDVKGLRA